MSRNNAPRIVYDDAGTVGFLESADRPGPGASEWLPILLDDGRKARVPADRLILEADGRYRLEGGRADLEAIDTASEVEESVIPVVAEEVEVGKRKVERGRVRVRKGVETREQEVAVPLVREEVEVERVPMNRPVDTPPQPRQEGDVWIVPVLEEVLVVEKRLVLKEELRITRRRVEETARERVTLRTETATVERVGPGESSNNGPIQT